MTVSAPLNPRWCLAHDTIDRHDIDQLIACQGREYFVWTARRRAGATTGHRAGAGRPGHRDPHFLRGESRTASVLDQSLRRREFSGRRSHPPLRIFSAESPINGRGGHRAHRPRRLGGRMTGPPDEGITIKTLAESIAQAMAYSGPILFDRTQPEGVLVKRLRSGHFTSQFPGFQFTGLQEGLTETVRWFVSHREQTADEGRVQPSLCRQS